MELGQLMLAMVMFEVRRVLVLYLEEKFPQISGPQQGSSWAKRSLRTMGSLSLVFLWHQRLILIQLKNQFMVCWQKALKRERNLHKIINLWQKALKRERNLHKIINLCKTHMNSHQDVQEALFRERNLPISGTTTFILRKFRTSRRTS